LAERLESGITQKAKLKKLAGRKDFFLLQHTVIEGIRALPFLKKDAMSKRG